MDPTSTNLTQTGAVVVILAGLVGLALAVKKLFWTGEYDVTRREFEELKAYVHVSIHEIRDLLNEIKVQLATLVAQSGKKS